MVRCWCFGGDAAEDDDEGSRRAASLNSAASAKYEGDGITIEEYEEKLVDEKTATPVTSGPTHRRVRLSMNGGVFEPGKFHKAPVNATVMVRGNGEEAPSEPRSALRRPKPTDGLWREGTVVALHATGNCDVRLADGRIVKQVHAKDVKPVDIEFCLQHLKGKWFDGNGSSWVIVSNAARETSAPPASVTTVHPFTHDEATGMVSLRHRRIMTVARDLVVWTNGEVWRRTPSRLVEMKLPHRNVKFCETERGVVMMAEENILNSSFLSIPSEFSPPQDDTNLASSTGRSPLPSPSVTDLGDTTTALKSGVFIHAINGECVMKVDDIDRMFNKDDRKRADATAKTPRRRYMVRLCQPAASPANSPTSGEGVAERYRAKDEPFDPKFLRAGDRARALWGGQWHACTIVALPGEGVVGVPTSTTPAARPETAPLSPRSQIRRKGSSVPSLQSSQALSASNDDVPLSLMLKDMNLNSPPGRATPPPGNPPLPAPAPGSGGGGGESGAGKPPKQPRSPVRRPDMPPLLSPQGQSIGGLPMRSGSPVSSARRSLTTPRVISEASPRGMFLRRASKVVSVASMGENMDVATPQDSKSVSDETNSAPAERRNSNRSMLSMGFDTGLLSPRTEASDTAYLLSPTDPEKGTSGRDYTVAWDFDPQVWWRVGPSLLAEPLDEATPNGEVDDNDTTDLNMSLSGSQFLGGGSPYLEGSGCFGVPPPPGGVQLGTMNAMRAEAVQVFWCTAMDLYALVLSNLGRCEPGAGFTRAELLQELRLTHTEAKHVLRKFQFRHNDAITVPDWMRWYGYLCENDWAESYIAWMMSQLRGPPPFIPPPSHAGKKRPSQTATPIVDPVLTEPGKGMIMQATLVRREASLKSDVCGFLDRDALVHVVEVGEDFARIVAPTSGWVPLITPDGDQVVVEMPHGKDNDINTVCVLHCARQPLGCSFDEVNRLKTVSEDTPAARSDCHRYLQRTIVAIDGVAVKPGAELAKLLRSAKTISRLHFKPAKMYRVEYRKLPNDPFKLEFREDNGRIIFENIATEDQNYPTFNFLIDVDAMLWAIDGSTVTGMHQIPLKGKGTTAPVFEFMLPEGEELPDDSCEEGVCDEPLTDRSAEIEKIGDVTLGYLMRSQDRGQPGVSRARMVRGEAVLVPRPPPVVLYDVDRKRKLMNTPQTAQGPLSMQLAAEERRGVQLLSPGAIQGGSDITALSTSSNASSQRNSVSDEGESPFINGFQAQLPHTPALREPTQIILSPPDAPLGAEHADASRRNCGNGNGHGESSERDRANSTASTARDRQLTPRRRLTMGSRSSMECGDEPPTPEGVQEG